MDRQLNSVADLLLAVGTAATTFRADLWWRGQARAEWSLVPGVFRRDRGHRGEQNMTFRFRTGAPSRHQPLPDLNDAASWLSLMQHHGLPTRLLDWCETPLAAAFFTVADEPERSGALYALSPHRLNGYQMGEQSVPHPNNPASRPLFAAALTGDQVTGDRAIAVMPAEVDTRMLLQQSRFTVHSSSTPLEAFDNAPQFLMRFVIPPSAKPIFTRELQQLGVRRSTLFPDLDNLAADIASMSWVAAPPAASGQQG